MLFSLAQYTKSVNLLKAKILVANSTIHPSSFNPAQPILIFSSTDDQPLLPTISTLP